MPIARFQMEDGRIARFEVPEGTTPEQAHAQIQELLAKQESIDSSTEIPQEDILPEGSALDVILEPAQAIASGLIGDIGGGFAATVAAPFVGAEGAEDILTDIQKTASEFGAPETQRGQEALQTVGDLMQKGVDLVNFPISGLAGLAELISGQDVEQAAQTVKSIQDVGVGKTAGQRAMEVTGSPLFAAVAETTPAIIGSIIPIKGMVAKRSALNKKLADKIVKSVENGAPQRELAKYIVDGAGKVKADSLAKEAIKQGFDQSVIAAVKGSSKIDKAKMSQMVDIMKKGKENAIFAMKNRPSDIAGNSLLDRVNHIKKINRVSGKQVDKAAKALKGQDADFSAPINNFMESLDEMGIRINKNLKPIFKGSDIEGLAGPEAAIKNIVNRLSSGKKGVMPDAHEMHRMKRYIDEIVTYGKEGEGLKGKTERILKSLRRDLDGALDNNFPEYNKANTIYSDTVGALDALQDVAGKKMDLFGPNADKATGTLLRRMMSNAQSRVNLVDAVDNLDSISKKYGGKFTDDISAQMLFVDELDTVFGPTARTSLAGEMGKSVKKGAEAVTGQRTAVSTALDLGAAGIEKLRGINEESAFKAINELLKRKAQ